MPFAIAFCLAAVAGLDLDTARELPWRGYVDAQIMRLDDRVLPPPPNIAVYFGSHKEAFAEGRGDASDVREALAPVMPPAGDDRSAVSDVFGNVYADASS